MKIVLPIPSANIGGNQRGHSRYKAPEHKKCRDLAHVSMLPHATSDMPWPFAVVRSKFFFKRNGRRDQENFLLRLKPYFDGFVDAGLCPDDDWKHMDKLDMDMSGIDKENPRVEFTFEKRERRKS